MSTITPERQTADPPKLAYDAPVPDILNRAADHAERHTGGTRTLVADAIGAALGHTRPVDVDFYVIPSVIDGVEPTHPAFAAVMAWLAVESIQSVFRWSALQQPGQIADVLRDVAVRAAVTCVSCGAEWPNHTSDCEFIRPVRDELRTAVAV